MIDYQKERAKYCPRIVETLLIGEAPPPSGNTYFYVPKVMGLGKSVENDTSLPATIFNHYFGKRPESINEYKKFLITLKHNGIYLIDIIDEPIKIRGNKENESYLISKLPELRNKIANLKIDIAEDNWKFLLARNSYKSKVNQYFPKAGKVRWKDFRLNIEAKLLTTM